MTDSSFSHYSAPDLHKLITQLKDLPTLPILVVELLEALEDENVSVGTLAQKINQDPTLTAKTIRFANSPLFSPAIKITTIQQAITILGLENVKQIALSVSLSGYFPTKSPAFDYRFFWRHSNLVAFISKLIARRMGVNEDIAFIAGLLHDIGVLALVSLYPDYFEAIVNFRDNNHVTHSESEMSLLEFNHAQIGDVLAKHWQFSDVIRHAIAGHHFPDEEGIGVLASVVHVADAITHMLFTGKRLRFEAMHLDNALKDILAQKQVELRAQYADDEDSMHASKIQAKRNNETIVVSLFAWNRLQFDEQGLETLLEMSKIKYEHLMQLDL